MPEPALFITAYGPPAAERLRRRVAAAKADDPLRPVTVVVPANSVGVSARRMLAGGARGHVTARGVGVAGLTVLTVYRLAELLGAPALAAAGRRPVSTPLLGAAVRQVLRDEPGIFAPVATHPSTEEALVRAHHELSALRPASLSTLERQGRRSADVVRVHRAVRRRVTEQWYEEADLMSSATDVVRRRARALDDIGVVVIYLPQVLSGPAADLLRTVADNTIVEVVVGATGDADADADVVRTVRRLGLAPPDPLRLSDSPVVDEVVSVSDAEEEVRSAIVRVVAAARSGVPLDAMAVLYPHAEPYARIVHDQFAAAGIASNGPGVVPLSERVVGRWLLDLLALRPAEADRPSVMGVLTAAPLVGRGDRRLPTGAWEAISRAAGIVRGRDEWMRRLGRYADARRSAADAADAADDAPSWRSEQAARDARSADALRAFVRTLFATLDRAGALTSWHGLAQWCRTTIDRFVESDRSRWPVAERDAAERVDATLDRLAGLDAVEARTDLATFRRTLQLALDDDLGRVGRLGHGVLVGTPSTALGVELDLVIVLGMSEGVTPTRPHEDSLLPDAQRRAVADELRPRDEYAGVQRRHLVAALAAADRRVLIHPRGDLRRSVERAPSRWLLDAVATRRDGGHGSRTLPAAAPWLHVVPSFAARVRSVEFPATRQEHALRVLASGPTAEHVAAHPAVAADDVLRRAVALRRDRDDGVFGRYTGRLAGQAAALVGAAVGGTVTSPTALERWLRCPHAYLLGDVLRVRPVDNPEEVLEMSALDVGSLIHRVLERWLRELLDRPSQAPADPWPPATRLRLAQLAEQACAEAEQEGVTGHPLLWGRQRRQVLRDLETFLEHDDERRRDGELTPLAVEHPFGPSVALPQLSIDLGDGRVVAVRGQIDRLDRRSDGGIVVADYKTGRATSYGAMTPETPLADGTRLQLPLYGLAARQGWSDTPSVAVGYWFVSDRGAWKWIGYPVTDGVVEQLRHALRVVVDGIAAGLFPMRPAAPVWRRWVDCDYCDPDGLGTADHYRTWERVRTAPALRAYVTQVEPDTVAPGAADTVTPVAPDALTRGAR